MDIIKVNELNTTSLKEGYFREGFWYIEDGNQPGISHYRKQEE